MWGLKRLHYSWACSLDIQNTGALSTTSVVEQKQLTD